MYLEKNNIPYTTFKKSQLTKDELDERMKENSIKVLTIHTAKGLEADNVVLINFQNSKLAPAIIHVPGCGMLP